MTALTLVWDGKPTSQVVTVRSRDAKLFALVDRFREVHDRRRTEYHALQSRKRIPDRKARWAAWQAGSNAALQMEKEIVLTPARTIEGAKAKAQLGYLLLYGDDWEGDDFINDTTGHCCIWALALSGTRDLLNVVDADKAVQA